jgi:hypothetical protein
MIRFIRSGIFDLGEALMMMQSDQNHKNLLPLFVLAIVILLVFAWTYIR